MNEPLTLKVGDIATNCYILYNGTDAVVVDPGGSYETIGKALENKSLVCKYVLLTHGHWDHISAAPLFQKEGAEIVLHESDREFPYNAHLSVAELFGATACPFNADITVKGGETLELCGMKFRVLHTPGHTEGSVCYVCGNEIYSGDTLFFMSAGRTDFPTGNENKLKNSIKNVLFDLEGDYTVYPGHDRKTSLNFERKYNPYV